MKKNSFGFGLVETIVALGVFSVVVTGAITGFIPALQSGRSGREQTQAINLAQEGIEAVRSIRDQSFNSLTSGTFGVGVSNNLWVFSGSSDVNDKYTRTINIINANRDTGGSLVSGGGTTDPDTLLINSTVSWSHSIGDTRQISLSSYLTNWRKTISSGSTGPDALIVYTNSGPNPRWRTYTISTNTFGTESTMPSITGDPRTFVIKASPTSDEFIAGTVNGAGVLYVYCFDGSAWTQDWSVTVGGSATTRRFDIAYEKTTGNAMVVYSTNTATTNEIAYRVKTGGTACGSGSWASAANFNPVRTSGIVHWVKLAPDQRSGSNLIATIWADSNSDLSAAIWDGSSFVNEPSAVTEASLEIVSNPQDVDDFDLAYESLSGDLMVVWANSSGSNGTNGVRYRTCTGGTSTCTWGSVTTPPTFRDDATNLDLAANPTTDEMVFASIGNAGSDLQIGYWNGSSWTNRANIDTSSGKPLAGTKLVATVFLASGATSRYVVIYMDSTGSGISYYVANAAGAPVKQTDFAATPAIGNPKKWIEARPDLVNQNQAMVIISDVNSDLFAKRVTMSSGAAFTWDNADGGAALELTLGQPTVKPFAFVYRRQ